MGGNSSSTPGRRGWRFVFAAIAGTAILTILVGLLFPWMASAYYLERGGKVLSASGPTDPQRKAVEGHLKRALAWDPENAQAHRLLARLYREQGDWPAAARALARYVAIRPRDPLGYWELALVCEEMDSSQLGLVAGAPCGQDETRRPAALARLWAAAGQSALDFVRAGNQFLEAEMWAQAETYYRRAMLIEPEMVDAWLGLGDLFAAQDKLDMSLETYAYAANFDVEPREAARAYARRGALLVAERRWQEAKIEFGQALDLDPDGGEYHLNYGWSLYKAGGPSDEARAHIVQAATLLPKNPQPPLRLAELDLAKGDAASALAHARQTVRLSPTLVWGWLLQGRALAELDRFSEAVQSLQRAAELAPQMAVPRAELGALLQELGRRQESIEAYEKAAELDPHNVHYYLALAGLYRASGYDSQSRQAYQRVLELDPENEVAQEALHDLEP